MTTLFDIAKEEAKKWANSGPDISATDWRTIAALGYTAGFQHAFERRDDVKALREALEALLIANENDAMEPARLTVAAMGKARQALAATALKDKEGK